MPSNNFESCGRVFFYQLIILMTLSLLPPCPDFERPNNLANNHSDPHVSHIFGKLSLCSFTWSYPGRTFLHTNFENKQRKPKMHFFAIFHVAPSQTSWLVYPEVHFSAFLLLAPTGALIVIVCYYISSSSTHFLRFWAFLPIYMFWFMLYEVLCCFMMFFDVLWCSVMF